LNEKRRRTSAELEEEVRELFGTSFDKIVSRLSDRVLVEMGKEANVQDKAVINYSRPQSREYYRKRPELEAGIMRIWNRASAQDREKMIAFLRQHQEQESNDRPWWKFW